MTQEFGIDVLSEADAILADKGGRNFDVEMTADFASSILAYVQVAQRRMIGMPQNGKPNEKTQTWSLVERFNKAIPIEHKYEEVPVTVSLGYRDVDFIGRIMRMQGKRVVPLFMGLNDAFVEAGGDDNSELVADYENIPLDNDQ